MFTLLLGYFLGLATTYYFEEIFNNSSDTLNLKSKFNSVLKESVYAYIDKFETNSSKSHQKTQDLIEDEMDEVKSEIKNILKIIESKKEWFSNLDRASP